MKTLRAILAVAALTTVSLTAATVSFDWNSGFAAGGLIPDGNITGWSDSHTFSGIPGGGILDVDVRLNIAGGFNGDYYAYLTHNSGISILLNRIGSNAGNPFGSFDSGLNVTLDDGAPNGDIHLYESAPDSSTLILSGASWIPDGRNIDPLVVLDTDPPTNLLGEFDNMDANGEWTLFVADLSNGEVGTIASWGLTITTAPVPEASTWLPAMLLLGAIPLRALKKVSR